MVNGVVEVSVLERAEPAAAAVFPQRSRTLGMALIMSLMLGGGLAFLQEIFDDRLRSGEEIADLLGLPILGVIPTMREKVSRLCGQVVSLQPRSGVAEAFRTFRTTIHFSPRGGQTKVIMVTSPALGDGTSTVASNLAIAIAQGGKRTILIDADCRKPGQHQIFGASSQRGLSTLLGGDASADGRAVMPVVPTGIDHLDLMPAGPQPDNPSELLSSRRFARVIARLREHYDQIIIDTPPTVPVSDSRIISTVVDGYVLVLSPGKSGRKTARQATELLASVGATPLGLVVNGVVSARGSYGDLTRRAPAAAVTSRIRKPKRRTGWTARAGSPTSSSCPKRRRPRDRSAASPIPNWRARSQFCTRCDPERASALHPQAVARGDPE